MEAKLIWMKIRIRLQLLKNGFVEQLAKPGPAYGCFQMIPQSITAHLFMIHVLHFDMDGVKHRAEDALLLFGNDCRRTLQAFCRSLNHPHGQGYTQLDIFLLFGQEKKVRLKSYFNSSG